MKSGLKHILKGMASIGEGLSSLNLFPPPTQLDHIAPLSAEEAMQRDAEALRGDWEAVGNDLRAAMDQIDAELAKQGIPSPREQ